METKKRVLHSVNRDARAGDGKEIAWCGMTVERYDPRASASDAVELGRKASTDREERVCEDCAEMLIRAIGRATK